MVAMVEQLRVLKGKEVTLEFQDGEVVDAKVVDIDAEHNELIYDVLAVRRAISEEAYPRTKVYTAPIATVASVRAVS